MSRARGSVLQCARKAEVVVTPALDTCFVDGRELTRRLPLGRVADSKQKPVSATTEPLRRLGLRESSSLIHGRLNARFRALRK
jgi:hypothetical protein